jgi:hypothetical protein
VIVAAVVIAAVIAATAVNTVIAGMRRHLP